MQTKFDARLKLTEILPNFHVFFVYTWIVCVNNKFIFIYFIFWFFSAPSETDTKEDSEKSEEQKGGKNQQQQQSQNGTKKAGKSKKVSFKISSSFSSLCNCVRICSLIFHIFNV
jgi:hypothetical protein